MKPEQINKIIAEYVGVIKPNTELREECFGLVDGRWVIVPDYFNDLNAMHEAEKALKCGEDQMKYAEKLSDEIEINHPNCASWEGALAAYHLATMPAPQRATAFVKTIGKWTQD